MKVTLLRPICRAKAKKAPKVHIILDFKVLYANFWMVFGFTRQRVHTQAYKENTFTADGLIADYYKVIWTPLAETHMCTEILDVRLFITNSPALYKHLVNIETWDQIGRNTLLSSFVWICLFSEKSRDRENTTGKKFNVKKGYRPWG